MPTERKHRGRLGNNLTEKRTPGTGWGGGEPVRFVSRKSVSQNPRMSKSGTIRPKTQRTPDKRRMGKQKMGGSSIKREPHRGASRNIQVWDERNQRHNETRRLGYGPYRLSCWGWGGGREAEYGSHRAEANKWGQDRQTGPYKRILNRV